MNVLRSAAACLLLGTVEPLAAEGLIDRLDEALTVSAFNGDMRARLSGTLDLEGYYFPRTPPGLIHADADGALFNPRLTLFLDTQLGPHVYAFAQARADRGFDPGDGDLEVRLDEYAIRLTPWEDGRFNLQIGQFATVGGGWITRHLSWDNPFVNAPLPYENVTAVRSRVPPYSAQYFAPGILWGKYDYLPVIWGPSYATGISVAGRLGRFDYAAELKNASLSSVPESWSITETGFEHPTLTGRIGFRPDPAWNLGLTASRGPYLMPEAAAALPSGRGLEDYQQITLGHDISFAWHHWQLWAEVFASRFEVPHVGNADTLAGYFEAKYKFTPQLFGALRWNQQFFSKVPDGWGGEHAWGDSLWRLDAALGYRFTPHTQLKLQYSPERATGGGPGTSHNFAVQFTVRF
ncbi:MAG: hypothetical protein EOP86_11975 [Verrucomicrobiaceae bacterium]|nr:MAG: hypothetical protein EOP86_11975 [Verrucomicrobiaceae bacterium]